MANQSSKLPKVSSFFDEDPLSYDENSLGGNVPNENPKIKPQGKLNKKIDAKKPTFSREKLPVIDPVDVDRLGAQYAEQARQNGNPISDEQGALIIGQRNTQNIQHNNYVDSQETAQRARQAHYGEIGKAAIGDVYKDVSKDVLDIFQKEGQSLYDEGYDEAEISKRLNEKAAKIRNDVVSLEGRHKARSNARSYIGSFLGTSKSQEKNIEDMRGAVKPLLDEGLYDVTRQILGNLEYEREEIESIVSNLGEGSKKELSSFPDLKKRRGGWDPLNFEQKFDHTPLNENQQQQLDQSILNVFENDPSTNLILLRKAYEDKGVRWDEFSDSLKKGIASGKIKLNDEQQRATKDIDEPPMKFLHALFHTIGLKGR